MERSSDPQPDTDISLCRWFGRAPILTRGVLDGNCDLLKGILNVALVPLSMGLSKSAFTFPSRGLGID